MGITRIVNTDFWKDEKIIDNYSPEDKYFWLYLLTNPQTRQLGVYKLPRKIISFETGYSLDTVNVLLERFETKYKTIIYSKETQEIAILNYLKYSIVKGGQPVIDCIKKDIGLVKDTALLSYVYNRILESSDERVTIEEIKKLLLPYKNDIYNEKENDIYNDNDNDSIVPRFVDDSLTIRKASKLKPVKPIELTEFEKTIEDYKIMRKSLKKPMTDRAVELMLSKLDKLSKGDESIKIKILEQSIENSWLGIFELKQPQNNNYYSNNQTPQPTKGLMDLSDL